MGNKNYLDYLTGINNRMGLFGLYDRIDPEMNVGVLFIDLDNFKTVNDTYGHKAGDEVLIEFAQMLRTVASKDCIVARLGGDEFAAILTGSATKEDFALLSDKLLKGIRELRKKNSAFDIISASIGIIHNYPAKKGLDDALKCADKAMYYAKEQGKNTYVFYSDYEKQVNYENKIEKDLFDAIKEHRIDVQYHPVHQLQSSRIICTEACCLWRTKDGDLLGRNDFRSILVKSGLIDELDMYVFETVCSEYSVWKDLFKKNHLVCVQFSHLLFLDETKLNRLVDIMTRYNVSAEAIEINLDENMFSSRIMPEKIIEFMCKLKEIGFSLGLSHFGEDFSSVRYLKRLPISKLKLDGDFISDNLKDKKGIDVFKNIIKLGRSFKFTVVGCRADDSKTMAALAACGCDATTGEFYCKKLSLEEYIEYVKKNLREDKGVVSFRFLDDFSADKRFSPAIPIGEDVELVKGISNTWGAVSFPGGPSQMNILKFPEGLFDTDGYTFSMWIKPRELQNWISALYVRYQAGFLSFMPNIAGGRSMVRWLDDTKMNEWHDLMTGAITVGKWTFVACTYDSISAISRIYINGEPAAELTEVPHLSSPKEVWLGGDVFQPSFCGLISAFQVSSTPLESAEIRQIYERFLNSDGYVKDDDIDEVVITDISVHDPAIFEDKESRQFYIYGTGGAGFKSSDMIHWKSIGTVVGKPCPEAISWTKSEAIWAPDIVKVGSEYRLYCSNSSWGVRQSCIFLAVADSPEGPFIPKGIVVKTDDTGDVNAIDANIIEDASNHRQYMVYGSFWGGIHIVELDKETGLLKEGESLGKCIARRPLWNDGAIEGPYIIYHPGTEYYYLFVSYGSLKSDYNIRVGRSKCITGPYVDFNGVDMTDIRDTGCSTGLMISCGYRYLTGDAMMGPGHNSVLLRENGEMYLVNHIRKLSFNNDPGPGLLQIRKMIMTPDGWPITLGEPHNAEALLEVRDDLLYGEYERIELRPSIPQGIQHAHPMSIQKGGRLEMASVIGTWKKLDPFTLQLEYGPVREIIHYEKGLDKEKNKTTVVMGGLTSSGICTWAKKEDLAYD